MSDADGGQYNAAVEEDDSGSEAEASSSNQVG